MYLTNLNHSAQLIFLFTSLVMYVVYVLQGTIDMITGILTLKF